MATKKDLDFTYSSIDKIFRLSFGEMADYSGARFDGDFSMSLEQGQKQKHQFIAESLNIRAGSKVLDMACGWGPFLNYLKSKGAKGKGVTLSQGQALACVKNGLDVDIMDCRTITRQTFGQFDAVTCIGGLEHFCSVEEYKEGKQDEVYSKFFKNISDLLPAKGRFYMQTMVFTKATPQFDKIDIRADKNSVEYALALMIKQFPGSWLPYSEDQVIKNAAITLGSPVNFIIGQDLPTSEYSTVDGDANYVNWGGFFTGDMDDVMFYNIALDGPQVASIFTNQSTL